ncbi:MAG TPA: hypothetical protein VHA52_02710 [Candidatus Babeliaceae bacterium]|nr:hypothetical protein [Candidatus Babeliaceae bacterium]
MVSRLNAFLFVFYCNILSLMFAEGNVDPRCSHIIFPCPNVFTSVSNPPIIGVSLDDQSRAIATETIINSIDGLIMGEAITDESGFWTYALTRDQALSEGLHTISAFATKSGVTLPSISFTVDTIAPPAPTINSPQDGDVLAGPTVTINGRTEPLASILIFLDSIVQGYIYADDQGIWSYTYDVDLGLHTVHAQAIDLALNEGPHSATVQFTIV